MYHKGSNYRDRNNPGKIHKCERDTKQVDELWATHHNGLGR